MLNKDKFATAQEAWKSFKEFCSNNCRHCPMARKGRISCIVIWLYADNNNGKLTPQQQEYQIEEL